MAVYRSKHANRKPSVLRGFAQLSLIVFVAMGLAFLFIPGV